MSSSGFCEWHARGGGAYGPTYHTHTSPQTPPFGCIAGCPFWRKAFFFFGGGASPDSACLLVAWFCLFCLLGWFALFWFVLVWFDLFVCFRVLLLAQRNPTGTQPDDLLGLGRQGPAFLLFTEGKKQVFELRRALTWGRLFFSRALTCCFVCSPDS